MLIGSFLIAYAGHGAYEGQRPIRSAINVRGKAIALGDELLVDML